MEDNGFQIKEEFLLIGAGRKFYLSTDDRFYCTPLLDRAYKFKIYDCNTIKDIQIRETDGSSAALSGALLFGATGAIVGSTMKKGSLVVVAETTMVNEPYIYIHIGTYAIRKSDPSFQCMVETADLIAHKLKQYVDKNQETEKIKDPLPDNQILESGDFFEKLTALVEMKKQGFLSDEEFQLAKEKLLHLLKTHAVISLALIRIL